MNSRQKGAAGEREAGHVLTEILGLPCRRGRQYQGSPDSPDVVGLPGLHLEVKRVEHLNLAAAMDQATHDAGGAEVPVVMHRRNRGPWMFTLRLADLPRLMVVISSLRGGQPGKEYVPCSPEQPSAPRS